MGMYTSLHEGASVNVTDELYLEPLLLSPVYY